MTDTTQISIIIPVYKAEKYLEKCVESILSQTEQDFQQWLYQQQKEIADAVAGYVKPGGTLVYSTCTLNREENEDVILRFLKENKNFGYGKLLRIIEPKQKGHGATTAIQVAAVVFLSNTLYSLIVNKPAKIIITAIIKKNSKLYV